MRLGRPDRGNPSAWMTPDHDEILARTVSLPSPLRVAYEAWATSKLQRPSGTGSRPASRMHRIWLQKLEATTVVLIPSADQERARDLVLACEGIHGDPMWVAA